MMLTLWVSRNSIKAFAGEAINAEKYCDYDANILLKIVPHPDQFGIYDE